MSFSCFIYKLNGRWVRLAAGVLISLLVIGWALWALNWNIIWRSLKSVHFGWVLVGVLLNLLVLLARAVRWGDLLRPQTGGFGPRFKALVIGQVVNQISPVRVGDLLRAYLFGEATTTSKARALVTIAVEKLWDLVLLVLFALTVGWFFPMPSWLLKPARVTLVVTTVSLFILAFLLWKESQVLAWISRLGRRWLPSFHDRLIGVSGHIFGGLSSARNMGLILKVVGWSVLIWLLSGLLNYAVFLAFSLPLGLAAAFLLLVVLQIGIAIPSLPGRIGVFQAICVLVLALFGVSFDVAFSYGIILHLVVFLPPMIVAFLLGWRLNLWSERNLRVQYD